MFKIKKMLNENVEKLLNLLKDMNLQQMAYILGSKREIAIRNFIAGISRGIGIGIGVTAITAIIIYFLQRLVRLNIPGIGKFIYDIMEIVEGLSGNKY